jgi:hypothetical protein
VFCYLKREFCYLKTEFCYFKKPTPTFLSAISAIMFHVKTSQTHDIPTKLRYWIPWTWKGHVLPAKNKNADSKSSAYLRGTWLKTKKYQTVILAYIPSYRTYHHTIPNHITPYHIRPYHTISHHTTSHHTTSDHTIPYHITAYHITA